MISSRRPGRKRPPGSQGPSAATRPWIGRGCGARVVNPDRTGARTRTQLNALHSAAGKGGAAAVPVVEKAAEPVAAMVEKTGE
jgi:hypothetical protein